MNRVVEKPPRLLSAGRSEMLPWEAVEEVQTPTSPLEGQVLFGITAVSLIALLAGSPNWPSLACRWSCSCSRSGPSSPPSRQRWEGLAGSVVTEGSDEEARGGHWVANGLQFISSFGTAEEATWHEGRKGEKGVSKLRQL